TPQRAFNLGTAQIAAGNREQGSSTLARAMENPGLRADALFNRGNSALAANAFDYAIHDYVEALKLHPKDPGAKRNLEIALAKKLLVFGVSAFCILHSAFGNELTVDKRTLQLDDTITITITVEDSFAKIDSIHIPLQNLVIDGPPSISSEFQWINGRTSRRKVFRYTAHPSSSGAALVGPLML